MQDDNMHLEHPFAEMSQFHSIFCLSPVFSSFLSNSVVRISCPMVLVTTGGPFSNFTISYDHLRGSTEIPMVWAIFLLTPAAFSSSRVKPRPRRCLTLYLSVGHRITGRSVLTGLGATWKWTDLVVFNHGLTRFRPNRVAADMEGDGEFDFWIFSEIFWQILKKLVHCEKIKNFYQLETNISMEHGHGRLSHISKTGQAPNLFSLFNACCSPADLPGRLVEPALDIALPVLVEVRIWHHLIPFCWHLGCLGLKKDIQSSVERVRA